MAAPVKRLLRLAAAALMISGGLSVRISAQNASAPALKAAFLVNFAKFAEWPAGTLAPDGAISFCVVGEMRVADALDALVKSHPLGDRRMVVQRVKADGGVRDCHVLYVQGLGTKPSLDLLQLLKGAPVFTVGDEESFAESGGVAAFFIDGSKMRFAVNLQSAQRAHVQLSSRLLALAKIVKDGPNVVQH
jgi:hypothetical protein